MKTVILAVLVGFLCGCTQKAKPDPRIEKLEAEVRQLQESMDQVKTNLSEIGKEAVGLMREMETNNFELQLTALSASVRVNNLMEAFEHYTNTARPSAAAYRYPQPATVTAKPTTISNGVPVSVYNSILAEAIKRYPTDYDMQDFKVRQQIDAYLKLHPR